MTVNSGDNDGFESGSGNACASGSGEAVDNKSGTADDTTCADANADRHVFKGYGVSLAAGAAINGIVVRLDAYGDNSSNSPVMCVELSWDGGVSWTVAKTTPVLANSLTTYTLGSATDTWGRPWIASELADGLFAVRITNTQANKDKDFYLDLVAVNVTYTPP